MNERMIELAKDALILLAIAGLAAVATLPTRAQSARELSLADVLIALRSKKADIGEKNKILTEAVKQRGITFSLTPEIEKELDGTGAANELIAAIREKMPAVVASVQTPVKPVPEVVKRVEDFAFFRDRAAAELKDGKNESAIADLEKAITMDAKDAGVRHDHAMLLAVKGDLESAADEYSRAAELAPQDVRNFIGRASVFERMGKPADALADYQKVLTINPADKDAAGAVVRISAAMTKAAMELAAKQQPVVEKKPDGAPTRMNAPEEAKTNTAEAKPQGNDPSAASEPTGPVNAGNLMNYCTDPVKPTYPQQAVAFRAAGDVVVSVHLDPEGHVVDAKATSGLAPLRAAAESAVRRSRFKPVLRNGKPVAAMGTMSYTFKM